MLVDGAALGRHIAPQSGQPLLQPSPAIDNQELRLAQPARDETGGVGGPRLAGLGPHILDRQQHLRPSWRTPSTTSSTIEVALRSSLTRTTVPSRIRRTIGSAASERAFQGFQSAFTLSPQPAHGIPRLRQGGLLIT